jgi:beta-lactamase superfamily II metal-dependent hydrolase
MATTFKYAAINEAPLYESVIGNKGVKVINRILLGTYVTINAEDGDFVKVVTAGPDGWMKKSDLTDNMGLKIFYLDVGQGDGVLIEVGELKILVDAGPGSNMAGYLTKWQYTYLIKDNKPIHIDYLFVSHFDTDHYKGFVKIIENPAFTFGNIYHAGILKFASTGNTYSSGIGDIVKKDGKNYLTKIFDNLLTVKENIPFNQDISLFMAALKKADEENRVTRVKRLKAGDIPVKKTIEAKPFRIEVLAPFNEKISNRNTFIYWTDEGKTINGHSLVLKITFGNRTFLLGGDLNTQAEEYLMEKHSPVNPFEVDVAKACHHGSSDFTEQFMQCVNPFATVISSGDNEGFSHPRADAIGCAGKYARGKRPLVYSTELARSVNMKNNSILFGMINLRCNGDEIYISQMKEVKSPNDLWDSYKL